MFDLFNSTTRREKIIFRNNIYYKEHKELYDTYSKVMYEAVNYNKTSNENLFRLEDLVKKHGIRSLRIYFNKKDTDSYATRLDNMLRLKGPRYINEQERRFDINRYNVEKLISTKGIKIININDLKDTKKFCLRINTEDNNNIQFVCGLENEAGSTSDILFIKHKYSFEFYDIKNYKTIAYKNFSNGTTYRFWDDECEELGRKIFQYYLDSLNGKVTKSKQTQTKDKIVDESKDSLKNINIAVSSDGATQLDKLIYRESEFYRNNLESELYDKLRAIIKQLLLSGNHRIKAYEVITNPYNNGAKEDIELILPTVSRQAIVVLAEEYRKSGNELMYKYIISKTQLEDAILKERSEDAKRIRLAEELRQAELKRKREDAIREQIIKEQPKLKADQEKMEKRNLAALERRKRKEEAIKEQIIKEQIKLKADQEKMEKRKLAALERRRRKEQEELETREFWQTYDSNVKRYNELKESNIVDNVVIKSRTRKETILYRMDLNSLTAKVLDIPKNKDDYTIEAFDDIVYDVDTQINKDLLYKYILDRDKKKLEQYLKKCIHESFIRLVDRLEINPLQLDQKVISNFSSRTRVNLIDVYNNKLKTKNKQQQQGIEKNECRERGKLKLFNGQVIDGGSNVENQRNFELKISNEALSDMCIALGTTNPTISRLNNFIEDEVLYPKSQRPDCFVLLPQAIEAYLVNRDKKNFTNLKSFNVDRTSTSEEIKIYIPCEYFAYIKAIYATYKDHPMLKRNYTAVMNILIYDYLMRLTGKDYRII